MAAFEILADGAALARLRPGDIEAVTRAATDSTFQRDGLSPKQTADIARIVRIAAGVCEAAAASPHQRLACAFDQDGLGGFVVATVHAPGDHELDWLMVHPRLQGTAVSRELMEAGMAWLGKDRPMWLNVLRHNERAIGFYRRYGFEIDRDAVIERAMPTWIMRRPGSGPSS